ncbi:MAG TPA: HAMP domain-containing sensor histidine kinase, partial [Aggregatilineales bacterium]|nr:HAMP domain-containing sensor histidine kinase [Aggregatilineales bacterium]
TLFFMLRSRPLLTETLSLRLYNQLSEISASEAAGNFKIDSNGPTFLEGAALNRLDKRLNARIILADSNGKVSYDTRHEIMPGAILNYTPAPYESPLGPDETQFPMVRGTLYNSDGSEWVFVGQAPRASDPNSLLFIVSLRAPRLLNLSETLNYYGEDLLTPLLQAGLIGLSVAFILSLLIARSVARPLQEVARAAVGVAAGDLDQQAPVSGPREVRALAESFNWMTEQVQASQQAQRDFLANVTHDLRTPLTSIQGFSQAIIEGVASNPSAAQRAAQIINDEAGRLNRMVQELLDLARVEAGRLTMRRHVVNLTDLLCATGERLTPRAAEKSLSLRVEVPQLPTVAGDGDRLVQVYTNLVDNAIKHTPAGGMITLRAAPNGAGVVVQVRDTGEGIPATDLPHVFDRFYQVDKSRQRAQRDGAGLGLTITRGIIEAHGGRIWVESQEGVGTMFSTWLPALSSDASTIIARRRSGGLFKPPVGATAERRGKDQ